jgi:hypothetical protein
LRHLHTAEATLRLIRAEQAEGPARSLALKEAKAACKSLRRVAKADVGALVAAQRLQGTYEWLAGRSKKAESWWHKSLAMAEKLGARYEGALTEFEAGRRLGDRAALDKAAADFEAMGAAFDLKQTQDALGGADEK